MSRTYITKHVPAKDISVEHEVFCDLCKSEIDEYSGWDVNEVTIEGKTGYSCPSGGSSETQSVDMCIKCFEGKLIPWLKEQGADIQKSERNW